MKIIRISAIWCTSCILTKKDFDQIKEKYNEFEYEELDYDTDDIEKYDVKDIIPVVIMYKEDKEVGRIIGEKRFKDIDEKIKELI